MVLSFHSLISASMDDFSAGPAESVEFPETTAGMLPEMSFPEDTYKDAPDNEDISAWLATATSDFEQGEQEIRIPEDFSDQKPQQISEKLINQEALTVYVNPAYQDVVNTQDFSNEQLWALVDNSDEEVVCYETVDDAVAALRQGMIRRQPIIKVGYLSGEDVSGTLPGLLFDEAVSHTGDPVAGDYLKYHLQECGIEYTYSNKGDEHYLKISYMPIYFTTPEQEAVVTEQVQRLLSGLDLEQKNDYEKVKAIYDAICTSVVYDNANLNDNAYVLKYTAYAALINKTSVCQGYANLMYRLLLEAGVDCRLVTGDGSGEVHAWNIVRLGERYYSIDATWDAVCYPDYAYFLKGSDFYSNHTLDAEFTAFDFTSAYPISETAYVPGAATPTITPTPEATPAPVVTAAPAKTTAIKGLKKSVTQQKGKTLTLKLTVPKVATKKITGIKSRLTI